MEIKEICWDREVREAVWKKGRINPDYSPHVLRWDDNGRIMMWSKYQHTDSRFGWTIEVRESTGEEDPDTIDNLYPVSAYKTDRKDIKDLDSPSTGG